MTMYSRLLACNGLDFDAREGRLPHEFARSSTGTLDPTVIFYRYPLA